VKIISNYSCIMGWRASCWK